MMFKVATVRLSESHLIARLVVQLIAFKRESVHHFVLKLWRLP